MKMMLVLAGTSLGGWIGWALGDRFGMMAAFMLSLVGTAAGLYFANRIARNYLP